MVENLNVETFKKKVFNYEKTEEWQYEGGKPAIIDFYADWCGPCKSVAPILDELSNEYDGKVDFYKVDTDKEGQLAGLFGIQSIPSLLFVPMTDKPQMAVGALPKEALKDAISKVLGITE